MTLLTDSQIATAARAAGFTGGDVAIAVAVALAESGGRSDAVNTANKNGSTDYGLWQINSVHAALLRTGSWSNPADNARMARSVFTGSKNKWTPWSTYNNGRYLTYMPRGLVAAGNPQDASVVVTPISTPQDSLADKSGITGFASFITDPNTWRRLGYIIVGAGLFIWAMMNSTGDNQLSETTKAVGKLAIKAVAA